MKKTNRLTVIILAAILIAMIVNSAALSSTIYDGIILCLRVVIPSLFPFFVLCTYMNGIISQSDIKFLRPIGKFCRIPQGSEQIFLIGLLGGYPIGAQCVTQSYDSHILSKSDAERMLGFCNNAGPAFIFGMLSAHFSMGFLVLLWVIQIVSSILTAHFLPQKQTSPLNCKVNFQSISISKSIEKSLKAISSVCCWVVIFKVAVSAIQYYLVNAPMWVQVLLFGLVELVNGCNALSSLESTGIRFIIVSALLSFGGVCVHMQTVSVTKGLRKHIYMHGKLLQTAISTILALIIQLVIIS